MNIVWQELKKIVSLKKLLYLAGFYVLYFLLFLKPYIISPNATSYHDEANLVKSFIEEYGTELAPEEFQDLRSKKPEYEYDAIDRYIASTQDYTELGIHDFQELNDAISDASRLSMEESNRIWFKLYDGFSEGDIAAKMQSLIIYHTWNQYIETYEKETAGGTIYYEDLNQNQLKRIEERGEKEVYGLVPNDVLYNNFEVLRLMGTCMALGMMFMTIPYMVSENRSRMPSLQYSFQKGRSSYGYRLAAVLLSCMLTAVLVAAVYGWTAVGNRVTDFWNCSISGYSTAFISWFPWTMGQYTVFHLTIAAAFSTGLSLMLFAVTHYLDNYVTAIAWALPAVAAAAFFCGILLYAFGEIARGKWPVPLAGATVLGLGILAAMLQGLREMRRDVGMY